jgi:archaellum component FlaC
MANHWENMNHHEKLETLRRGMAQILDAINALSSDIDGTCDAMKGTRSDVGKIAKEVGTLRALWPYTRKYSQAG